MHISQPDWSPDGKQIVFAENQPDFSKPNDLYILNLEDGKFQSVLEGQQIADPDWSPDGKKIALSMVTKDVNMVAILDLESKVLSAPLCTNCFDPVWRPNIDKGTRIY